ncbi:MAG: efflux transporter outer membrane subunit [Massilia sp.]
MHAFKTITIAATLALAGCAVSTPYRAPAEAVPVYPAGAAYDTGCGTAPSCAAASAAALGWQDVLGDARLQRLEMLALANNRDLRVAVLTVQSLAAQARLQQAAGRPQLGVAASAGASGGSGEAEAARGRKLAAGLQLNWETDLFGRLGSLDDAAAARYLAGGYGRQAAQTLLVAQVAEQYYATVAADAQLALAGQAVAAAGAALHVIELQHGAGIASALDVTLAQTALQQAQADQAAQLRLQAQAVNALVQLVGAPLPADLPAAPAQADSVIAPVPAGLSSDLLRRRPDIAQAEALLRASHADVDAARAAFFPTISLTGGAGVASSALSGLFGGAGLWSFVPSLAAPLLDGGANDARLAQAKAAQGIAVATYEKAIQAAFREVSDGLAARGTYDTQVASLAALSATSTRRLALATQAWQAGTGDYLGVLAARTDLVRAQDALVTARQQRATSLVALYRALGGGWLAHTGETPPSPLAVR